MVRAILEGRKTQTRRVVKPQPTIEVDQRMHWNGIGWSVHHNRIISDMRRGCPYGDVGDRLWVRETLYAPNEEWLYRADDSPVQVSKRDETAMLVWTHHKDQRICPTIHMPRWASRILLEITEVRVERVQSISAEDCIAEGLSSQLREHDAVTDLREQFGALWDGINAKRFGKAWADDPWVWCISFKVLDGTARS